MAENLPLPSPNNESQPPEERFWQRYSPHHEFPLSGVTSFVIHSMAFALLIYGVVIADRLGLADDEKPLPLDAIVIAGGGGHPEGVAGFNDGGPPQKPEVGATIPQPDPDPPSPDPLPDPILPRVNPDPPPIPQPLIPPSPQRVIAQEPVRPTAKILEQIREEARQKLLEGLRQDSPGEGGPGSGGGKDKGRDIGRGDQTGSGQANITPRQQRVLRWSMVFNTQNGEDYRRQLAGLGAYLGIPLPEGGYKIFRNLAKPPYDGKVEDPAAIGRIFWVDNKPGSVASLSLALRLQPPPPYFVAFFPKTVETELLQRELRYAGRREDQIGKTVFEVRFIGGRYQPVVTSQEPAP